MNEEQDNRIIPAGIPTAGALALLQLLTKRFPPIPRHSHSLTLYQGKLQVNLVTTAPCWKFTLDAEDMMKPPAQLVMEIARLIPKDPPKPAA